MRKLLLFFVSVCLTGFASGQTVRENVLELDGQNVLGYSVTVPNVDVSLATAALKKKMETQYALKSSRIKGYTAFLNQPFPPLGTDSYSIYAKVTESGKRTARITVVRMIVCDDAKKAITNTNDATTATKIKSFLTELVPYMQKFAQQHQIDEINSQLQKLEAKKTGLQKDRDKIMRRLRKLEKNMEKTDAAIRKLNEELQNIRVS